MSQFPFTDCLVQILDPNLPEEARKLFIKGIKGYELLAKLGSNVVNARKTIHKHSRNERLEQFGLEVIGLVNDWEESDDRLDDRTESG